MFLTDPGNCIPCPIRDLFWCATGEVTLEFVREEGGPSKRWEGGSTKTANAVLAFLFLAGSTLIARSDDP